MNVQRMELEDAFEVELRTEISLRHRLSPEDIARADVYMQNSQCSFSQSVLQLGLVSQRDIDAATDSLRILGVPGKEGLIEAAIHKLAISEDRRLVVQPSEIAKPSRQLLNADDPYNERTETIRALRTELLLRNEARQANVLCVVSPSSGEGRSQLAAEVALAFAQLGRRTLLVDGDMRSPRQHRLFTTSNGRGLSESLMHGERPYSYTIDGLPLMSLITTGAMPSNPLELLSSGRFERLLQDWRKSFEFVVIDTPPARRYADALAISSLVGRVLFVARAKHTRHRDTRETLRRLATTRALVLGAVINRF